MKSTKFPAAAVLLAAVMSMVAAEAGATTYRCALNPKSNGISQFVPKWIEVRRTGGLGVIHIYDEIMEARGLEPIRAKISRENKKVLAMTWKSYPVGSGFNGRLVRPDYRLSFFKSKNTGRLNSSASKGDTAISADARCEIQGEG